MSQIAIRCEGLSKQYRTGQRESYKALRDVVAASVALPFRRARSFFKNGNGASPDSRKRCDLFWALEDISFEVKRGEVIGVIGRNGAGKSTLLKILSRITKPTLGAAEIHGRVGSLLEVGTGFHPELTGRENTFLNGAILGMRKAEIERNFDEIVAFAEIEKFIDTPVKRYSSGMYVRLAFAVAAFMDTEVLLIDEVLAVGDAAFQKKCLGRVDEVARRGRTVMFVSHDMTAIQMLCQKSLYLAGGKVAGFGESSQQIANYLSLKEKSKSISNSGPRRLAGTLDVHRFEFSPNPVRCGEDLEFAFDLSAVERIRLDEIAVLIYSSTGRRVAILDLRSPDRVYRINGSSLETVSGRIKGLPLVEGDYQIGLYLNWGLKKCDFYDLAELSVVGTQHRLGIVPYNASERGSVELNYELD